MSNDSSSLGDSHHDTALRLLSASLYEDALVHFNKALFFCPNHPQFLIDKAELLASLLDFRSAISCIHILLQNPDDLKPSTLHKLYSRLAFFLEVLAKDALLCDDVSSATSLLFQSLSHQLSSHRLFLYGSMIFEHPTSESLFNLRNFLEMYQASDFQKDSDYYLALSLLYLLEDKKVECISTCKVVLSMNNNCQYASFLLSVAKSDVENLIHLAVNSPSLDRALILLDEVLSLDPDHLLGRSERGKIFKKMGYLKEAVNDFRLVLDFCSTHDVNERVCVIADSCQSNLIECVEQLYLEYTDVNPRQALHYLNIGLNFCPSNISMLISRGDVFLKLKNLTKALGDYTAASQLNNSWELKTKLAIVHYQIGVLFLMIITILKQNSVFHYP
ncbi:hypothetical protein GEMRC1_011944 [Eukaryota sp. GEM-RC1]